MSSTCMRLPVMLDNWGRCASWVACDVEGGDGSDAGDFVAGGEEVEQDELTKFPMRWQQGRRKDERRKKRRNMKHGRSVIICTRRA